MRLISLMVLLLTVNSCNKVICKDSPDKQSSCPDAIVRWAGAPEADGLGWVLQFSDGKIEKPSNLSDSYKIDNLKVSVCSEASTEKFPCFCVGGFKNMVKIVSITKR